jgi:hypothetical protein
MASYNWLFRTYLVYVVSGADMIDINFGEEEDAVLLNTQLLQTKLHVDHPGTHSSSSADKVMSAPASAHDATLLTQVGFKVSQKHVHSTNHAAKVPAAELPGWLLRSRDYLGWLLQDVPDIFAGLVQKNASSVAIPNATSDALSLLEWQRGRSPGAPAGLLILVPLSIALMVVLLVFSMVCYSREGKGRHPAEQLLQPQPVPRSNDALTVTKSDVSHRYGTFR